jgi:hypothetical protein
MYFSIVTGTGTYHIKYILRALRTFKNISEPVFLNAYGAQESIPRNDSTSLCSLAGRYDNPIPTRCLAPIDCLKIPAQITV